MTLSRVLAAFFSSAPWAIPGGDAGLAAEYSRLEWRTETPPKPTLAEIEALLASPEYAAWEAAHGGDPVTTTLATAGALLSSTEPVPVGVRAGLIAIGQRLNELIQAYQADRATRGLPALTLTPDVTSITPEPLTVQQGKVDAEAILTETTWMLD